MSNNLTKRHIVQKIYEQGNYNYDQVRDIVQSTLDIMQDAISKVKILNLENLVSLNFR